MKKKKLLTLILSLCFILSLSMTAFASGTDNTVSTYAVAPQVSSVEITKAVIIDKNTDPDMIFYPNTYGHVGVWVRVIGSGNAIHIKYDGEEVSPRRTPIIIKPILYSGSTVVKGFNELYDCCVEPTHGEHTFEIEYRSVNHPYTVKGATYSFTL